MPWERRAGLIAGAARGALWRGERVDLRGSRTWGDSAARAAAVPFVVIYSC